MMNLYVYYDERYLTNWISDEISLEIKNFLQSKGFHVLNADELAEMMRENIYKDTCWNTIIVFSRDVVPETICHYPYPNTLIRKYLDRGGTIVWFGDIPLYYIALSPQNFDKIKNRLERSNQAEDEILKQLKIAKDKKDRFARCYELRASFNILEVIPILAKNPSRVKITRAGKELGLRSLWYSDRPILIRGLNLRKKKPLALATSKPRYILPFERAILDQKKERRFSSSIIDLIFKFIGLIPALITLTTALYLSLTGYAATLISSFLIATLLLMLTYFMYWLFWSRITYAGAWFKNFDKRYPNTGFYRIWDFMPDRLSKDEMEELYTVIHNIKNRVSTSGSKTICG